MTIGQRILKRRTELKLTQRELARRLRVDVSSIAHWENDDWRPRDLERVVVRGLKQSMVEFWSDSAVAA